jgi:hypothetical protein
MRLPSRFRDLGLVALWITLLPGARGAEPPGQVKALDQFTITIPAGWYVHDQNLATTGKSGTDGVIVFTPADLAKLGAPDKDPKTAEEARRTFTAIDSGQMPSFFVERYAALPGVTCATGLTPEAREKVLEDYKRTARGPGNWEVSTPKVDPATVGDCKALRVQLSSKILEGGEFDFLIYVVSDGKTMYDFTLRNRKDYFEKNRPLFEQAVTSIKLSKK